MTRALSRLKSACITLDRAVTGEGEIVGRKSWNDFYSPVHSYAGNAGGNKYLSKGEFEFKVQLGSELYSEYPIRSHAEGLTKYERH